MAATDLELDFTSPKQAILLFLDFDGVLHPVHCSPAQHLCCRPLLEDTLRSAPPVEIVISSTWQEAHSVKALTKLFSPDMQPRIIGGTLAADPDREEETRYDQILRFLRWKNWTGRPWLALDDADHEFPEGCSELVLCNGATGFETGKAQELLQRLRP
ncbi:MAG: hypothetical protein IH604_16840 [Burkholderiales bacterium]|nr:hypothetical protein [Burkholderiales bacterium]